MSQPLAEPIEVTGAEEVYLKVSFRGAELQFYYAIEPEEWRKIGPLLDGSILSDDYVMFQEAGRRAQGTSHNLMHTIVSAWTITLEPFNPDGFRYAQQSGRNPGEMAPDGSNSKQNEYGYNCPGTYFLVLGKGQAGLEADA